MSKANIISFSTRGFGSRQEQILESIERKFIEVKQLKPDLICFAEEILISGGDRNNPENRANNEKALELAKKYAVILHSNIAISLEEFPEYYPGHSYNTAYVINRSGEIIAKYRKRHITFRAFASGGIAGERYCCVDTDIGRLGMLVCFDVGWREDWQALADMGAQLVWWPSAYHGGNLLNAYAAVHMYNIVTSVWNAESRIIDRFGNTIAESSGWDPFVCAQLDLNSEIFHFDHHEQKLPELRCALGDRISIRVEPKGNMFELSVNDPTLTIDEIKAQFGLESYRDYHTKSEADNISMREAYPEIN